MKNAAQALKVNTEFGISSHAELIGVCEAASMLPRSLIILGANAMAFVGGAGCVTFASRGAAYNPEPHANIAVLETRHDAVAPRMDQIADIPRAKDGLFYVTGEINGARIRFVVDTGATVVVLTPADAQLAGLTKNDTGNGAQIQTVTGSSTMRWAKADEIKLANKRVRHVDIAVVPAGLKVSLLGQNVLSKLGNITLKGDHLSIS